jgi:hypothetical protein
MLPAPHSDAVPQGRHTTAQPKAVDTRWARAHTPSPSTGEHGANSSWSACWYRVGRRSWDRLAAMGRAGNSGKGGTVRMEDHWRAATSTCSATPTFEYLENPNSHRPQGGVHCAATQVESS